MDLIFKFSAIHALYIAVYVLVAPVISGLMMAFILNKEFQNKEYLWKVCVTTIAAFCGIIFLPVYLPMFAMWAGMYFIIKRPAIEAEKLQKIVSLRNGNRSEVNEEIFAR